MTLDKTIKPIVMLNIVDTYFFKLPISKLFFNIPQHSKMVINI